MIFAPIATSTAISKAIYCADIQTRRELEVRTITREPDYVSALVTRIRDRVKRVGLRAFGRSRVLYPGEEKKFGCDAMIVFVWKSSAKVCLFEAKWPRMLFPNYRWDNCRGTGRRSHFATQLARQSSWSGSVAIWEQFLVELPSKTEPPGFDRSGSTCVWHHDAINYDKTSRSGFSWQTRDVHALLHPPASTGRSLQSVVQAVLRCRMGLRHSTAGGNINLSSSETNIVISVPVSGEKLEARIDRFCEEFGLRGFLILSAS